MCMGNCQYTRFAVEHFIHNQLGKSADENPANVTICFHRLETSEAQWVGANATHSGFDAIHEIGSEPRIDLQIVARGFEEFDLGGRIK